MRRGSFVLSLAVGILSACGNQGNQTSTSPSAPSVQTATSAAPAAFAVSSSDLVSGHWPRAATCDGGDAPPDLHWTTGPEGTASFALQVYDPDAPNGGFTHWMLANEPPDLRQPTPGTGVSGKNDFGHEGYNGPCPPHGTTHHYVVTVYAVDTMLPLERLYTDLEFQLHLAGHVLAKSSLTATYGR